MKKITIIFMSVLMIFASCSMDTSYDDANDTKEKTNTKVVEEPKEDDSENNTEEPSKEKNDSENNDVVTEPTENNNDKGNSENTEIVEDEPSNKEPKEDDFENNTEEPSNEENDEVVENKTWCEISEDTNILELNYFVCVDGSQTKLNLLSNNENEARKYGFRVSVFVSISGKKAIFNVEYKDGKLNFSDNNIPDINKIYTITNVTMEGSNVNITIEWK